MSNLSELDFSNETLDGLIEDLLQEDPEGFGELLKEDNSPHHFTTTTGNNNDINPNDLSTDSPSQFKQSTPRSIYTDSDYLYSLIRTNTQHANSELQFIIINYLQQSLQQLFPTIMNPTTVNPTATSQNEIFNLPILNGPYELPYQNIFGLLSQIQSIMNGTFESKFNFLFYHHYQLLPFDPNGFVISDIQTVSPKNIVDLSILVNNNNSNSNNNNNHNTHNQSAYQSPDYSCSASQYDNNVNNNDNIEYEDDDDNAILFQASQFHEDNITYTLGTNQRAYPVDISLLTAALNVKNYTAFWFILNIIQYVYGFIDSSIFVDLIDIDYSLFSYIQKQSQFMHLNYIPEIFKLNLQSIIQDGAKYNWSWDHIASLPTNEPQQQFPFSFSTQTTTTTRQPSTTRYIIANSLPVNPITKDNIFSRLFHHIQNVYTNLIAHTQKLKQERKEKKKLQQEQQKQRRIKKHEEDENDDDDDETDPKTLAFYNHVNNITSTLFFWIQQCCKWQYLQFNHKLPLFVFKTQLMSHLVPFIRKYRFIANDLRFIYPTNNNTFQQQQEATDLDHDAYVNNNTPDKTISTLLYNDLQLYWLKTQNMPSTTARRNQQKTNSNQSTSYNTDDIITNDPDDYYYADIPSQEVANDNIINLNTNNVNIYADLNYNDYIRSKFRQPFWLPFDFYPYQYYWLYELFKCDYEIINAVMSFFSTNNYYTITKEIPTTVVTTSTNNNGNTEITQQVSVKKKTIKKYKKLDYITDQSYYKTKTYPKHIKLYSMYYSYRNNTHSNENHNNNNNNNNFSSIDDDIYFEEHFASRYDTTLNNTPSSSQYSFITPKSSDTISLIPCNFFELWCLLSYTKLVDLYSFKMMLKALYWITKFTFTHTSLLTDVPLDIIHTRGCYRGVKYGFISLGWQSGNNQTTSDETVLSLFLDNPMNMGINDVVKTTWVDIKSIWYDNIYNNTNNRQYYEMGISNYISHFLQKSTIIFTILKKSFYMLFLHCVDHIMTIHDPISLKNSITRIDKALSDVSGHTLKSDNSNDTATDNNNNNSNNNNTTDEDQNNVVGNHNTSNTHNPRFVEEWFLFALIFNYSLNNVSYYMTRMLDMESANHDNNNMIYLNSLYSDIPTNALISAAAMKKQDKPKTKKQHKTSSSTTSTSTKRNLITTQRRTNNINRPAVANQSNTVGGGSGGSSSTTATAPRQVIIGNSVFQTTRRPAPLNGIPSISQLQNNTQTNIPKTSPTTTTTTDKNDIGEQYYNVDLWDTSFVYENPEYSCDDDFINFFACTPLPKQYFQEIHELTQEHAASLAAYSYDNWVDTANGGNLILGQYNENVTEKDFIKFRQIFKTLLLSTTTQLAILPLPIQELLLHSATTRAQCDNTANDHAFWSNNNNNTNNNMNTNSNTAATTTSTGNNINNHRYNNNNTTGGDIHRVDNFKLSILLSQDYYAKMYKNRYGSVILPSKRHAQPSDRPITSNPSFQPNNQTEIQHYDNINKNTLLNNGKCKIGKTILKYANTNAYKLLRGSQLFTIQNRSIILMYQQQSYIIELPIYTTSIFEKTRFLFQFLTIQFYNKLLYTLEQQRQQELEYIKNVLAENKNNTSLTTTFNENQINTLAPISTNNTTFDQIDNKLHDNSTILNDSTIPLQQLNDNINTINTATLSTTHSVSLSKKSSTTTTIQEQQQQTSTPATTTILPPPPPQSITTSKTTFQTTISSSAIAKPINNNQTTSTINLNDKGNDNHNPYLKTLTYDFKRSFLLSSKYYITGYNQSHYYLNTMLNIFYMTMHDIGCFIWSVLLICFILFIQLYLFNKFIFPIVLMPATDTLLTSITHITNDITNSNIDAGIGSLLLTICSLVYLMFIKPMIIATIGYFIIDYFYPDLLPEIREYMVNWMYDIYNSKAGG